MPDIIMVFPFLMPFYMAYHIIKFVMWDVCCVLGFDLTKIIFQFTKISIGCLKDGSIWSVKTIYSMFYSAVAFSKLVYTFGPTYFIFAIKLFHNRKVIYTLFVFSIMMRVNQLYNQNVLYNISTAITSDRQRWITHARIVRCVIVVILIILDYLIKEYIHLGGAHLNSTQTYLLNIVLSLCIIYILFLQQTE